MMAGGIVLRVCMVVAALQYKLGNHLAQRLIDDIIINKHYNPRILPVNDASDRLPVNFRLSLQEVMGVDADTGRMTARAWITMTWTDVYLQWDRHQYGEVLHLYLLPREVWNPDIWLLNGVEFSLDMTKLTCISDRGSVFWKTTAEMTVTCDFRSGNNATWVCPLEFISWTYDSSRLDLRFGKADDIDDDHFRDNTGFPLVVMNYTREEGRHVKLFYELELGDSTTGRQRRQKIRRKKKRKPKPTQEPLSVNDL